MEPISADIVESTWQRMAAMPSREAPKLVARMEKEQPVVMAYLMAVDHDLFNQEERELLLYLGMVVWQIMSQGSTPLPRVTEKALDRAEKSNMKTIESLMDASEADFTETARTMIENYSQPEVLRYVVEALVEAVEDEEVRDENMGIMMLDLKTVIDCFHACGQEAVRAR